MILFYALAVLLIATAIFTVAQKSPVYSVIGLLSNFVCLAALYFTLDAEFLGIVQIVVYSGAILMLFVFVIALLSSGIGPFAEGPNRLPKIVVPTVVAALVAFALLAFGALHAPMSSIGARAPTSTLGTVGSANVFGSVGDFGVALFTTHLLPFEITAFVLMVAVVGVVAIAGDASPTTTTGTHGKRKRDRERIEGREPIVKAGRP